jgi:hypothetical protein
MKIGSGNRSTEKKPLPLCSPQIPPDLTWNLIRTAAMGSWQLFALVSNQEYRVRISAQRSVIMTGLAGKLVLTLAGTVVLGSESQGTLSQLWESCNSGISGFQKVYLVPAGRWRDCTLRRQPHYMPFQFLSHNQSVISRWKGSCPIRSQHDFYPADGESFASGTYKTTRYHTPENQNKRGLFG